MVLSWLWVFYLHWLGMILLWKLGAYRIWSCPNWACLLVHQRYHTSILVWMPLETNPKMRFWGQIVYLGGDHRKPWEGDGEASRREKRANKGCLNEKLPLWATRARHCWGPLGEIVEHAQRCLTWGLEKLGHLSTNSHWSLVDNPVQ